MTLEPARNTRDLLEIAERIQTIGAGPYINAARLAGYMAITNSAARPR
jgi:hypothetical protein